MNVIQNDCMGPCSPLVCVFFFGNCVWDLKRFHMKVEKQSVSLATRNGPEHSPKQLGAWSKILAMQWCNDGIGLFHMVSSSDHD